ncbi:MAG TPA: hypothetical protein VLG46_11550 [Anaerolineae bacterium]|nr:hypothetical protein [Anaerolineae bacterium]
MNAQKLVVISFILIIFVTVGSVGQVNTLMAAPQEKAASALIPHIAVQPATTVQVG